MGCALGTTAETTARKSRGSCCRRWCAFCEAGRVTKGKLGTKLDLKRERRVSASVEVRKLRSTMSGMPSRMDVVGGGRPW